MSGSGFLPQWVTFPLPQSFWAYFCWAIKTCGATKNHVQLNDGFVWCKMSLSLKPKVTKGEGGAAPPLCV